jgi:hypothetical protein
MDLFLGVLFYREHLYLLTSWIHHIAYFVLCTWVLGTRKWCPLFAVCCLEELPTLVMAAGRLDAAWRSDLVFGVTYFATRICLHAFLVQQAFAFEESFADIPAFLVIRFNFALTMCLHGYWFHCFARQQVRLAGERAVCKVA